MYAFRQIQVGRILRHLYLLPLAVAWAPATAAESLEAWVARYCDGWSAEQRTHFARSLDDVLAEALVGVDNASLAAMRPHLARFMEEVGLPPRIEDDAQLELIFEGLRLAVAEYAKRPQLDAETAAKAAAQMDELHRYIRGKALAAAARENDPSLDAELETLLSLMELRNTSAFPNPLLPHMKRLLEPEELAEIRRTIDANFAKSKELLRYRAEHHYHPATNIPAPLLSAVRKSYYWSPFYLPDSPALETLRQRAYAHSVARMDAERDRHIAEVETFSANNSLDLP